MNTYVNGRPFVNSFAAGALQETLGDILVRATSAFGGGLAIVALLAVVLR